MLLSKERTAAVAATNDYISLWIYYRAAQLIKYSF